MLDSAYVPSEDLEDLALGVATLLTANIRNPIDDPDAYEKILKSAFAISDEMASALRSKIETSDILGSSYKDASGPEGVTAWFTSFKDRIIEFTKKAINAIPGAGLMGWEIDPTQKYDIDKLYEWKLLGGVVRELNSRARFMQGQALLNSNFGAFKLGGDIENGDHESMMGDAIRIVGTKRLPSGVFAGAPGLAMVSTNNEQRAAEYIRKAASSPNSPEGRALVGIMNSGPNKSVLAKFIGTKITKLTGDAETGDLYGDAYSTISANYGTNPAVAWQMGDVEGFLREVGAIGDAECTTGDPELDSAIEHAVYEETQGDVENMSPEMGGIFMRARINAAKRKAAKRGRRAGRKTARIARKDFRNESLIQAKNEAAHAGFINTPEPDESFDEYNADDENTNMDMPFPEDN